MLFCHCSIFAAVIFLVHCICGNYSLDNMVAVTPKESKKHNKLTSEELSLLHTTVKDISHSKGGMSDKEEELKGIHHELRRSVIRKATIQSESDNLEALLSNFQHNISDKISLLQAMKDLVHQYDVGINLVTMGGLDLLLPHLSSSDENIVSSVLSVLGAAIQGNPHVQKAAFQKRIGHHLRNILSESPNLYSRGMIVLSGFLRNLPEAQKEFFASNGALILANVLQNHVVSTDTKLKIINLLSDLAVEFEMTKQYSKNFEDQDNDKTFLYRLFYDEIKKYNICNLIPRLLDLADFDTHQKVVEAMNSLKPICIEDFQTKEIQLSLAALLIHYDPSGVMNYPLFPLIDPELKEMLFQQLKILYSSITPETQNENEIYSKKTEL